MKRTKLLYGPARVSDMSFENLSDSMSDNRQNNKAQRIEVRRWRKLKHQLS